MKTMDFVILALAMSIMGTRVFADGVTIVDKNGGKTELTSVKTETIAIVSGSSSLVIALSTISSIRLADDGKTLILKTVGGKELTGTSSSNLEGEWELGKYSIALSSIKSADFGRPVQPPTQLKVIPNQPDGFVASCTDRSGKAMDVFGFCYNFSYSYATPGWIGRTSTEGDNPRQLLPFEYKGFVVGLPFTDILSVKFTDKDVPSATWQWQPSVEVALKDGKTLQGKMARLGESYYRFTGVTEFGRFALSHESVHQIIFDHGRDKNAKREPLGKVGSSPTAPSGYILSIKTWDGEEAKLQNGCVFSLEHGFRWNNAGTAFDLKIGESQNTVGFDKIKAIRFLEKGKLAGELTSLTGKTMAFSMSVYNLCLGGDLEPFGTAWIGVNQVASLEISRKIGP